MNVDIIAVSIGIVIGFAVAIPLTLLFDKRAARERSRNTQLSQQVTALEAQQEAQQQQKHQQMNELEEVRLKLEASFSQAANKALTQNSSQFLELANQNFSKFKNEADSDLKQLINPLREHLSRVEEHGKQIELKRVDAYSSLVQQVQTINESTVNLRDETSRLVQALRQPKTKGRWGEIQLQNVLELVGMQKHIDFKTEESFSTDEGKKRPDVVVRLPGDRCIVIDAKTPIDAYLTAIETEVESDQNQYFIKHAKQLRDQVNILAKSDYQHIVPYSPDFVVMFIPGEAFYSAAVEYDPTLFEYALNKQVLITTPMSLILLLKVAALGWQQENMSANSRKIVEIGRELYNRLNVFSNHIRDHGNALTKAVNLYNKAVGSMESRVLPSARKLEELEVTSSDRKIPCPDQIEKVVRTPDINSDT